MESELVVYISNRAPNPTHLRPDRETCPICGAPFEVIQINSEPDYVRVGCWNHWHSNGVIKEEPIRSIDGKPATDFSGYKHPCVDIMNINGYNWR